MYHDYVSVEQFMRERQRALLAAARRPPAGGQRGPSLGQEAAPRPAALAAALTGVGRVMVAVGTRLEHLGNRATLAARTAAAHTAAAAGMCQEHTTALGC